MKQILRRTLWFFINNLWLKHYLRKTTTTSVLGFSLTIPPSVFHPLFTHSSKFFGEYILQLNIKNKQVLDMGTGSGILAIVAASQAASVTAVDINEEATHCAQENANGNKVHNAISFYTGNLFSPLSGSSQQFDFIFFNIPFYPKTPRTMKEHAWYAGENFKTIREFAVQLKQFLATNGKVYFIISSDVEVDAICSIFQNEQFSTTLVSTKKLFFETLFIFEVVPISEQM